MLCASPSVAGRTRASDSTSSFQATLISRANRDSGCSATDLATARAASASMRGSTGGSATYGGANPFTNALHRVGIDGHATRIDPRTAAYLEGAVAKTKDVRGKVLPPKAFDNRHLTWDASAEDPTLRQPTFRYEKWEIREVRHYDASCTPEPPPSGNAMNEGRSLVVWDQRRVDDAPFEPSDHGQHQEVEHRDVSRSGRDKSQRRNCEPCKPPDQQTANTTRESTTQPPVLAARLGQSNSRPSSRSV